MVLDYVQTRRFNKFHVSTDMEPYLLKDRSMKRLRKLAHKVWRKYGKNNPMPVIVAGEGLSEGHCTSGPGKTSYYDTIENKIVMCRNQRCYLVLLHELSHALTPKSKLVHGPAFVKVYVNLITRYGGEDYGYLALHLAAHGIKV